METQDVSEIWATREAFLVAFKVEVVFFPPKRLGLYNTIFFFFAVAPDVETEVLFMAASSQRWQFADFGESSL